MTASGGQTNSVYDPVMFQCDSGFSPADTMTAICTVGGGGGGGGVCGHLTQSLSSAVNHNVPLAPHLHQLLLIKVIIIIG